MDRQTLILTKCRYFCIFACIYYKIARLNSEKQHDKNPNLYNGEILDVQDLKKPGKKMYIESYGCQMNFSDSEIVASILGEAGVRNNPRAKKSQLGTSKHLFYP